MKKTLSVLLLLLPILIHAQKAALAEARPESAGMSSEKLRRLDSLLLRYVDQGVLPGAALIVCRDGKIVYHKAFGMRDMEARDPLERDDIFRIASMTKAITSTAAMMLFEEGKFALDDPISKFLPEFAKPKVLLEYNRQTGAMSTEPARSEITVRQLLNHTSGIDYGAISSSEDIKLIYKNAGIIALSTPENITLEENIKHLAALPLRHHPGEKWTYGMNTDVVGRLVEVWSGMSLADFFRTRIFEPLGMKDTYFYLPDSKKDRLTPVYTEAGNPPKLQKLTAQEGFDLDYPIKGAKKIFMGGAGLSSTALDYAIFLQMILNGGEYAGKRLLSRKTVELMCSNQTRDLKMWNPNDHFSLAFSITTEDNVWAGPGSVGKLGWGGYFSTHYTADPKERLSVVMMKQLQGNNRGWEIWPLIEAVIYGAIAD
jgi:CubicO group peptidase (beta-lactamase class C family)